MLIVVYLYSKVGDNLKSSFINSFFDNGIENYLLLRNDKEYNKEHIFEACIIRALVKIYGEINIMNPYKIKSENSFKCNLLMYGLSEKEMEAFFNYCNDYEIWLNSSNVTKTDLTTKIEKILVDMIIMKSKKHEITKQELDFFDKFFDPVGNTISKLHSLITLDNDIIPNYWKKKKLGLCSKVSLVDIRSDLLASDDYASYGIDIKTVENLSHEQVEQINRKIEEKEKKSSKIRFKPKNILLTTGSGFVDTIMLLSIMSTEVLIGIVLAFYFMRG